MASIRSMDPRMARWMITGVCSSPCSSLDTEHRNPVTERAERQVPTSDIAIEIVAAIESLAGWWHTDEHVAEHHEW